MTKRQPLPAGLTPRLLTTEQAAAYCGVGRDNFEARVGVPPVKLFGNRVLYDRIALDRWLDEQSGLALVEHEREDWLKLLK
jgi:hypothetical protein